MLEVSSFIEVWFSLNPKVIQQIITSEISNTISISLVKKATLWKKISRDIIKGEEEDRIGLIANMVNIPVNKIRLLFKDPKLIISRVPIYTPIRLNVLKITKGIVKYIHIFILTINPVVLYTWVLRIAEQ